MLTILDKAFSRNGQAVSRREFMRIGGLGLGLSGLSLPGLLETRALAGTSPTVGDKAVVLLFLQGGPTQHETWDPKPEAPKEYRTQANCIQTALPGVSLTSYFPKMAAAASQLAIVRSFASGNGGHTYESVTTGGNLAKASMSAVYGHLAGATHPLTGLPSNMLVLPEAVQDGLKLGSNFETGALPTLTQAGALGPQYEAFSPAGGSQLKKSMTMTLPRDRFDDRRELLSSFDHLRRKMDRTGSLARSDKFQQQAFDIITRGIKDAFDLGK